VCVCVCAIWQYDPVEKSVKEESTRNIKMLDRIMSTQEGGINVDKVCLLLFSTYVVTNNQTLILVIYVCV
jgi:hypothetical protein